MPGLTPQEQERIDKILAASDNPNLTPGEGFTGKVLVYMFRKIVDLRDFIEAQIIANEQAQAQIVVLRQRCKALEDRVTELETPPPPP